MRVVRFVLGGLVGLAVLIGGAVLVYVLTRPHPSTISVTPPAPSVPPVAPQPPRTDITQRAEKAVKIDRETRQESSADVPADGAKKRGRPPKARDTRLDLNTATAEQLEALPRIGPALAKRIVTYRNDYGNFNNVADIQKVSGIGPSVLEAIKDFVRI